MKVFYVDTNFLNTGGFSAHADHIYLPLYTHRPLCASRAQTLKHTVTNEHKLSRTSNPLVHIRYTIFSSCFSSAFPNGWLNQLCGAWFKSSGMLSYCQRLVAQPGGSTVTGGEQLTSSSTFIKVCFYQDENSGQETKEFENTYTILLCFSVILLHVSLYTCCHSGCDYTRLHSSKKSLYAR